MDSSPQTQWPAPLSGRLSIDASAQQVADAVLSVWREIDQGLQPIIGQQGVAALFHRSVHLASAEFPWLTTAQARLPGPVETLLLQATLEGQGPAVAAAGGAALLQAFRAVLVSLVGPSLTDQLLGSIWAPATGESLTRDITK